MYNNQKSLFIYAQWLLMTLPCSWPTLVVYWVGHMLDNNLRDAGFKALQDGSDFFFETDSSFTVL